MMAVVWIVVGFFAGIVATAALLLDGLTPVIETPATIPLVHGVGTLFHRDNVPAWRLRTGSRFDVVYFDEEQNASVVSYLWTGATWVYWEPS